MTPETSQYLFFICWILYCRKLS